MKIKHQKYGLMTKQEEHAVEKFLRRALLSERSGGLRAPCDALLCSLPTMLHVLRANCREIEQRAIAYFYQISCVAINLARDNRIKSRRLKTAKKRFDSELQI